MICKQRKAGEDKTQQEVDLWAEETMIHWVKAFVRRPAYLSSMPKTHMVQGENGL